MNSAYLPTSKDAARVGFGSVEPGFRIYAKHTATKELQELSYKNKNRAKLGRLAEPLSN